MEQQSELVLGSVISQTPAGYHLEAQLTQKGLVSIESILSSLYNAEFQIGQTDRSRFAPIRQRSRFLVPPVPRSDPQPG